MRSHSLIVRVYMAIGKVTTLQHVVSIKYWS